MVYNGTKGVAMSVYVQKKYIDKFRFNLLMFDWEGSSRCTFRCPYCGDSKKSKSKKRGNLFIPPGSDSFMFKCYNCQFSTSFYSFLEFFAPHLKQEYVFECFNGNKTQKRQSVIELPNTNDDIKISLLDTLPSNNPAVMYADARRLPKAAKSVLGYTDDFKSLVARYKPDQAEPLISDERLVIPFYSKDGSLIAFQGRALSKDAKMRYITVKVSDVDKIFGEDRLDRSKTVFCVEGPIDSLFIPNCIAVADGDLSKADADIYIPDNQCRNKQVMDAFEKLIDQGKRVVIFPNEIWAKDINDMIVKQNISRSEVLGLIAGNVYSGIQAKLKLAEKRKV